jgi:hypothetical protein
MSRWQNLTAAALVLCLAVSFGSRPGTCWADEQAGEPEQELPTAQLAIEGKFILGLVLEHERSKLIALGSPEDLKTYWRGSARPIWPIRFIDLPAEGETVSLIPGRYRWKSVIIYDETKKLRFSADNRRGAGWFNLSPDGTTTLTIGSPLKHSLTVTRVAGTLHMDYELLGKAGEKYLPVPTIERLTSPSIGVPTGKKYLPVPAEPRQRPKAPDFAIYKAGDKIFSGSLRYG